MRQTLMEILETVESAADRNSNRPCAPVQWLRARTELPRLAGTIGLCVVHKGEKLGGGWPSAKTSRVKSNCSSMGELESAGSRPGSDPDAGKTKIDIFAAVTFWPTWTTARLIGDLSRPTWCGMDDQPQCTLAANTTSNAPQQQPAPLPGSCTALM